MESVQAHPIIRENILCLPFFRIDQIPALFKDLCKQVDFPKEDTGLNQLYDYVYRKCISRDDFINDSTFPMRIWNCHNALMAETPMTNNSLEAVHLSIQKRVQIPHLPIDRLVIQLQEEEWMNMSKSVDLFNHYFPRRKEHKAFENEQSYKSIYGS